MAFSEYRQYSLDELKRIFKFQVEIDINLFKDFNPSDNDYSFLQKRVKKMKTRINLSKYDNEATRSHLLMSHILWEAIEVYNLGIFFEPQVNIAEAKTVNLPHPLVGKYDCGLSLNNIDFVSPIIAVVEIKRGLLSDGLGQCVAEMYATLKKFQQNKVYGIITDGEVWEFLLLNNSTLYIDENNYYVNNVADIIDRIEYIAEKFK